MSVTDIDAAAHRRMADYMRPADLNTDGCVNLVSEILRLASKDYIQASRDVLRDPRDKNAREYREALRRFYRSDHFSALSCGMMDGETVILELDKLARLGIKPREEAVASEIRIPDQVGRRR